MAYRLSSRPEDGYLHVVVSGENAPETVAAYMDEVRSAALEHGAAAVLIEENLTGPGIGIAEIFSLVSKGTAQNWGNVRVMAFVDTNPGHDPSRMRFAETVAVNRGVNVRVFGDVDAARAWLASPAAHSGAPPLR